MQILKYLTDTAVLWVKTGNNAYNELTFNVDAEISVRWEDRQEIFIGTDGTELSSRAIVHINQDIVPDSFMYLGELDDLTEAQKVNPKLCDDAFAVKAFRKLKSVSGKFTLRKVYLFGGVGGADRD